jgi:FAD/FMN-containing dehydrogenase
MELRTLTGDRTQVPDAEVEALGAGLAGELLAPGSNGYDSARKVWNGMIDRRPALIARCGRVDDVAAVVSFARRHGALTAVRGGGHGVAGVAVCDGGLVVDLSGLKEIRVDPGTRTVRAGGGCTLGELDRATQEHGLATPLGVVTQTGISGLTLAGGIGWLRRKHGMSCDNVVAAEVVTADGQIRVASERENPDLFWGIRGGGGNFGVVTALDYRLYPVGPEVAFCFVMYPGDRAAEVALACAEHTSGGRDEVSPLCVFGFVPAGEDFPAELHGRPFAAVLAMYVGDAAAGTAALRPLQQLAEPLADLSETMPYTVAQGLLDAEYPDGGLYYWKSIGLDELGRDTIALVAEHAWSAPSSHSTIDIWYHGGAMGRVGAAETAFGARPSILLGYEANFHEPETVEENVAWVRDSLAALQPVASGGAYLNFPGFFEEGDDLVRASYGENYDRLVALKREYDPDNLFRLNGNIAPR